MRRYLAGLTLALVVLAGFGMFYWQYVRNTPEELELTQVDSSIVSDIANDIDGKWTLIQSPVLNQAEYKIVDHPEQSQAGYRVDIVGEDIQAVGRTLNVGGSLLIADRKLVSAEITVDTDTVRSNNSAQDKAFKTALKSKDFPQATFKLSNPIGPIDENVKSINSSMIGDLQIGGQSKEVVVEVEAQYIPPENLDPKITSDTAVIQIAVSSEIDFEEFKIDKPEYEFPLDDTITIEVLLNFEQVS